MDKQKVIEAYRRGLITLQECGQILGAEKQQVDDILSAVHVRQPAKPKKLFIAENV